MGKTGSVHSERRVMRIAAGGWIAFALAGWLLAATLMSQASLMFLIFCLLVASLLLGAVETWNNLRRLRATLQLPDHAVAGQPLRLHCTVENKRRVGSARGVQVSCQVHPAAGAVRIFLAHLPARRQLTEEIQLVLPNRGRYRFSELELSTRFPFGVLESKQLSGQPQELLVYPRLGRLHPRFFRRERLRIPDERGRRRSRSSMEAEYHGLREFRDGDSAHWIHWPTTARKAKLMVKEFETRQNRNVAVLLDPWIPARSDAYHRELLELAISLAATLCLELCRSQRLHIVFGAATNPPVVWHGEPSGHLLKHLLGELALLEGTSEPAWQALVDQLPLDSQSQFRVTSISTRALDLTRHRAGTDQRRRRRWRTLTRRLQQLDVSSSQLNDYFELV